MSTRMRPYRAALLVRCLLLVGLLLTLTVPAGARASGHGSEVSGLPGQDTTGRVLVKFEPGSSARGLLDAAQARQVGEVPGLGVRVLTAPDGDAGALVARLRRNPNVEFAEPERVLHAFVLPNDPAFDNPDYYWGLARISAPRGWNIGRGAASVRLAIVDTGVDRYHPDLRDRYAGGYDFVNRDSNPNDDVGHGTHVAGIAAATGDNGIGMSGVGWRTTILGVKVLGKDGGTDTTVSRGIKWAADNGAHVINLSLGGYYYSSTLAEAVQYAQNRGVLVVAAAGNDGTSVKSYPAALPGVLAVSATTRTDGRAGFSNYGGYLSLSAPGVDIFSTYPGNQYSPMSGTSMAAPYVSGAAAVIKARYASFTAGQVARRLQAGADDLGVRGKDPYYGYGRLNLYRSLNVPGRVNGVVRNDLTGAPVPNARVTLKGTSRYVLTDAQGRYTLSVPAGSRTLVYSRSGYQSASRTVSMPYNGRQWVSVRVKPLAKLAGYVRDAAGNGISGTTVRVDGTSRTDSTDSSGKYLITNVPLGSLNVTASRSGYYTQNRSATTSMGQTTWLGFQLRKQ